MARKRTGHQPGRDSDSYEARQSAEVGRRAKAAGAKAPSKQVAVTWIKNSLATNERKMSISGSKTRERGRSRKRR